MGDAKYKVFKATQKARKKLQQSRQNNNFVL